MTIMKIITKIKFIKFSFQSSVFFIWKNAILLSSKLKLNIVLFNPFNPTINSSSFDKEISTLHFKEKADLS